MADVSDAAGLITPIEASKLRTLCDPAQFSFATTDNIEPVDTLIGQDRALNAVRFGSDIDRPGYNLFVLGPQGTGRHAAVLSYLRRKVATANAPDDWVYVHNFKSPHHPQAMQLPAGVALRFRDAMDGLIEDLRVEIPAVFQSDEYREKQRTIASAFEEQQEEAFSSLRKKAEARNATILRTPMGFALAPTHDGQVIKPEVFNALPPQQKKAIEKNIAELQKELSELLEQLPRYEKRHRAQVQDLNAEVTGAVVDAAIRTVSEEFSEVEAMQKRLQEVRNDLVEHAEIFLSDPEKDAGVFPQPSHSPAGSPRFNRYRVNVMVANDSDGDQKGSPLISEDHPTLANLIGRVEHIAQFGALITDFTMIRPGALHRANGGYLILDARKILSEPFAWEALKRTLRGGAITIVSAAEQLSLASTISLEPEPIPLKIKVVLIGERILYYLLSSLDSEFSELFKVEVDFDEEFPRTEENVALYARLVATLAKRSGLLAIDGAGVARVIEETSRFTDDAERLSLQVGRLEDLLGEADFWARESGRDVINSEDVGRAVEEQARRADRIRRRSHEEIERGTVLLETDGEAVGQINGLSVMTIGKFSFGRPSRITTRVRMGSGKVIDIERETKLGGPLHSKGVLILSSFLAANYARDVPMSLWASIVFEQSYGGVDGDSASSAELYSLLSALADVPIRQSLAVTGSVNQYGQVQAIGGVNEKIEGFFDICDQSRLTGRQGVLIPEANVKHLMLRPDIVNAAAEGRFHVYPVSTIAQGIALLTGMPAGERQADGTFPTHSINACVEATLRQYAHDRRQFAAKNDDESEREAYGGQS